LGIQESKYIWHNGELKDWHAATVHVLTHALHYGSSIFEGIRFYATDAGPCVFRLDSHLERFYESAGFYRMPISIGIDELRKVCMQVIRANELESGYLRPLAFHGYGSLGVDPGDRPAELMVAAIAMGLYLGAESREQGVDVCVSSWQRVAPNTIPAAAKAGGNYLSSQLIHMEAVRNGYTEGIGLLADGSVGEGSGENIFLVRNDKIYTPQLSDSILAGITRHSVICLANDMGYEVVETSIPRTMLYNSQEIFFTGTAAEITPVRSVDRAPVGSGRRGPVTKAIQDAFFGLFDGSTGDSRGWLQVVGDEG
jgi:branched-chain amino acid aminotransferase